MGSTPHSYLMYGYGFIHERKEVPLPRYHPKTGEKYYKNVAADFFRLADEDHTIYLKPDESDDDDDRFCYYEFYEDHELDDSMNWDAFGSFYIGHCFLEASGSDFDIDISSLDKIEVTDEIERKVQDIFNPEEVYKRMEFGKDSIFRTYRDWLTKRPHPKFFLVQNW